MSLDFVYLGADGRPAETVGIDVDAHAYLVDLFSTHELCVLSKVTEYYEDAVFEFTELSELRDEVRLLLSATQKTEEVVRFLRLLEGLIENAIEKRVAVEVLAD
jgi:hypothetical protein